MKPIEFKGRNAVMGQGQSNCNPLPAHRDESNHEGRVTSCWKLSFLERIEVLVYGKICLQQVTYYNPLQPVILSAYKADVLVEESECDCG